jgi:hypothetical protein
VRIEQQPGFMAPWVTLQDYTTVVLYADGRLIMLGPQIEIYPGPALPNLQVTQLTQAGVTQVLAWADEAGLKGPDRRLGPPIMDTGGTLFEVTRPDETHRTVVTDLSSDDPEVAAVNRFQNVMLDIRSYLPNDVVGDDQPYAFDRLRLISSEADPATVAQEGTSTVDWPLNTPIAELGVSISDPANYRCALIEGEDLQAMLPLFQQTNQLTLWRSEGTLYQLILRPLLPDEEPCPNF